MLLILISGFDSRVLHSAQQLAEAHNIKVLASLTKPIDIQEFVNILDNIKLDTHFSPQNLITKVPVSIEELRIAIEQQQLILYYQPQLDMKTGALQGVEALTILEHEPIDLLLSDVIMPDMDGYQLAAIVQEKYPLIKAMSPLSVEIRQVLNLIAYQALGCGIHPLLKILLIAHY